MVVKGYEVLLADTVTGRVSARIPVSGSKWGLRLNDAGKVDVEFPVKSLEVANVDVRAATTLRKQSVGVVFNDRILECGPIWGRDYDDQSGVMSLQGSGIWSILDKRKVLNGSALLAGANVTRDVINLTGRDLGSIAMELVRISIKDNPYKRPDGLNAGSLPIVLQAKRTGTASRVYRGFNLAWLGEELRKLTTSEGGPDIRFRPRFRSDNPLYIEWVMETGTAADPLLLQAGDDWRWDGTVEGSGVTGFGGKEDGTNMADKSWVPGSGQEVDMLLRSAYSLKLVNDGHPWTEADVSVKDQEDLNILQGHANRLQADSASALQTFPVTVRADADPLLGLYLPGEMATVVVPRGHPVLPPGALRSRIMAVDGDDSMAVKLTMAPLLASLSAGAYGAGVSVADPAAVSPALYPDLGVFPSDSLSPGG
jgi:hypothetical protein